MQYSQKPIGNHVVDYVHPIFSKPASFQYSVLRNNCIETIFPAFCWPYKELITNFPQRFWRLLLFFATFDQVCGGGFQAECPAGRDFQVIRKIHRKKNLCFHVNGKPKYITWRRYNENNRNSAMCSHSSGQLLF